MELFKKNVINSDLFRGIDLKCAFHRTVSPFCNLLFSFYLAFNISEWTESVIE
jgi:hypothetical protein